MHARTFTSKPEVRGDYVTLPIEILDLSQEISFREENFAVRPSFHVTVAALDHLHDNFSKQSARCWEEIKAEMALHANEWCQATGELQITLLQETRLALEDIRKTLIVMCKVDGAKELYSVFASIAGVEVEFPPTHVTLYTLKGCRNIGLANAAELEIMSEPVIGSELVSLQEAMNWRVATLSGAVSVVIPGSRSQVLREG